MSKSSGNFYTLRDLIEKGHDPLSIRYLLLQTHYRHSLNFTLEGLSAAARSVERLQSFRDRLQKTEASEGVADQEPITEKMLFCFEAALAEDLNISAALGILFDWLHQINRLLDEQGLSCSDLEAAREALQRLDTILGVIYKAGREVPESVLAWVERRQAARKAQEWEVSDQLRDWIFQAGYWIEDRADGTTRLKAAR